MTRKIKYTLSIFGALVLVSLFAVLCIGSAKNEAEMGTRAEKTYEIRLTATVTELEAANNEFTQEQFGGAYLEMPSGVYTVPEEYKPASGIEHPYLFFKKSEVEAIYENLMTNPDFGKLREEFWAYADAENFTGEFPEAVDKNGETYRFNTTILGQLEAKALAYLLKNYEAGITEDETEKAKILEQAEVYGYEAIIGAKNAILTMHYTEGLHMDTYHGASQTMVNIAKVFDWCYDLMSEDDKKQIVAGVSNILAPKMESGMRFPPSGMNGVSGHGTGPQFIRDWVTVSLAFYTETETWWNYVGGRFFEEYVPVIDYCYQGGFASQGTTTYGDSKYFTKGWAAWLIQSATGKFPYVDNFKLGSYFYLSHLQPNGKYFQTGDGGRGPDGCAVGSGVSAYFMAAMLFDDPTIAAVAKYYSKNYTYFSYEFTQEATVPDVLIWTSLTAVAEEELFANADTIEYLPYPSGTMTARESWDADAAAVLMRMGEMTMANHDLRDHGTFQIYYKGLLAGTSGSYKEYGGNVHRYYLQATVAHNGLLVFDPSLSDAEPIWNCSESHEHSLTTCPISNASRYFYSGSQYARREAGNIETWLGGEYNMSDVFAADKGYDKNGKAEWAYIAGDLTKAYADETVDYVGRKMLTVFTGDAKYPMLFFTYDQITSAAGGADFTKTFLLHTVKEPEIDETNLTAVVTEGEGRLFLHSVTGAKAISKIGGEGKAYWINGKNCLDMSGTSDNASNIWGRLELTTSGNLSDNMLTAMYVSDATNDKPLDVKKISSDSVDGAQIENNVVIFTKTTTEQRSTEFSFEAAGAGINNYFVSGVCAGKWKISVDGITAAYITVGENKQTVTAPDGTTSERVTSGLLEFSAPAGEVTVTPVTLAEESGEEWESTEAIDEVSLTLGNSLSLNYYVTDGEGLTMSFIAENGVEKLDVTAKLVTEGNMSGKYVFTFDNIGPHQLGMKVTAKLYSGESLLGTKEYSVERYCRELLEIKGDDEALVQLVNDLLLYAKAAEDYHSENAFKLGYWELRASEHTANTGDDGMSIVGNKSTDLSFVSVGVEFGAQNRIYFKISSSAPERHSVKVGRKTCSIASLEKGEDGYYKVYTDSLLGTELGARKLAVLNDGDEDVTTLLYSAYTYAYYVKDYAGASAEMKNLAEALCRYGKSCQNYVGTLEGDDSFLGKDNVFT